MKQAAADQRTPMPEVRFGVDLRATEASYRQALWGVRQGESGRGMALPAQPPSTEPGQQPLA